MIFEDLTLGSLDVFGWLIKIVEEMYDFYRVLYKTFDDCIPKISGVNGAALYIYNAFFA